MSAAPSPLTGLRVLDLTRLLPGPYASLVLADLGADVLKIEDPTAGDYLRWLPPLAPDGLGWAFYALNAGKRSLAVDLKHPDGAALLRQLVREADVLLESFRPGVMQRLSLDYTTLSAINPRLIFCSLTGYGQVDPLAARAGHDLNYLALSGVLGLTPDPATPPSVPPVQVADLTGSLWALTAILSALHARHTTGCGCHLDISLADSAATLLTMPLAAALATASERPSAPAAPPNPLSGLFPAYTVYGCADPGGWMAVAALEPQFWARFCERLNRPAWRPRAMDPALKPEVARLFATEPRAAWEATFADLDACVTPVLRPDELTHHPLSRVRRLLAPISAAARIAPLRLFRPAPASHLEVPRLGRDTHAVATAAGLDESTVTRLAAAGVLKL